LSREVQSQQAPQPRLVVISAPSGAGKTTLCERLMRDKTALQLSTSTTTRGIRPGETNGVHYHFVDHAQFQQKIDRGDFVEWAEVHGNRYGTDRQVIDQALAIGKHVVFAIDVQGAMNLRKAYGNRTLLIFIEPPSLEILEERLRNRREAAQSIETRLRNAYDELKWSRKFDYQIVNDDLERAYRQLREIVERECL
jgi:guanylate kinase